MSAPSIEPLDTATRAKIRSTQILTSLPQLVSELLQNSLDAEARRVEVGIDCEEWCCWVRDDGKGMSKDDLNVLGRGLEGGRYATSKTYSPDTLDVSSTFGFRGEALASAAELCCLEISSRTLKSRESWSVILKGGKSLYNGPSIRWRRESPGTVVSVRDAFYNLPIRRRSHAKPARTLELVRAEIEAYALVFPHVSFCLDNTSATRDGTVNKASTVRISKTASSLATFRHLYGRALAQHVEEVDANYGDMKLEGFISLDGSHSKAFQFLYVNRHPLTPCELHRAIDVTFAKSSFMKNSYDEGGETSLRSSVRRSPRKAERKPVYVLNLIILPRHVDNCIEPAKASVHLQNKMEVCSFLTSTIHSFLLRHGFVSDSPDSLREMDDDSPRPTKRRKPEPEDDPLIDEDVDLGSISLGGKAPALPLYIRTTEGGDENGELISWTDPITVQTYLIDPRTGHSSLREADADTPSENRIRRTLADPRWFRPNDRPPEERATTKMPHWMQKALQANKAYALLEPNIPAIELAEQPPLDRESRCRHRHQERQDLSRYFHTGTADVQSTSLGHVFTKASLSSAEVINQVDRKFIACLMGVGDGQTIAGGTLVLVDQHAADERIRVERLLKELCIGSLGSRSGTTDAVHTKELSPPVPVLLTAYEASRLASSPEAQKSFEHWGIRFSDLLKMPSCNAGDQVGVRDEDYVQVMVSSVPEVVSEKILIGDELRELIKGVLAKPNYSSSTSSSNVAPQDGDPEGDSFYWMRALRWCPRELLDLVNSKACRGAIMFNDPLVLEQCQRLMRQLSETAFPFQCAHGRPSLVPLVDLGSANRVCGRRHSSEVDWSKFS